MERYAVGKRVDSRLSRIWSLFLIKVGLAVDLTDKITEFDFRPCDLHVTYNYLCVVS